VAERTIGLGAALIILGIGTFGLLGFDFSSWTPLIPAFFGVPILALGIAAQQGNGSFLLLIGGAVLLATLAFAGTVSSLIEVPALLSGSPVGRPMAVLEQAITALLTGTYILIALQAVFTRRAERQSTQS
jgi:hypothetical protein